MVYKIKTVFFWLFIYCVIISILSYFTKMTIDRAGGYKIYETIYYT